MQFNIKKCKVVHFGKRNLGFMYSMEGHCLENVEYEKDLGVVMSKDLKVVQRQCQESYSMANRMLGLISRTFKYKNQEVLLNLYKSMMHPHLEYCCTVWSPHYIVTWLQYSRNWHCRQCQLREYCSQVTIWRINRCLRRSSKVQHPFTHMFPDLKNMPYEARFEELGLWSLEERRNQADTSGF